MPLSLTRFTVGPLMENCYLLADESTRLAVLVDPGDEAPLLLSALHKQQLKLQAIWLTHAHFDHIGAIEEITAALEVPVLLHPADRPVYQNAYKAAQIWDIPFTQPTADTLDLAAEQVLMLGDTAVRCLYTPGHAPGHLAFYLESQQLVLSGDALFRGSIGRTDLPFGNQQQLLTSIRNKLLVLPDDTLVYPGHGGETDIGLEKRSNPFL
jgi:hydroxyacylglutathione hydrolase